MRVAKTKTLISCVVTAQLICVFVFAKAKIRFPHNAAHMKLCEILSIMVNFKSHGTGKMINNV